MVPVAHQDRRTYQYATRKLSTPIEHAILKDHSLPQWAEVIEHPAWIREGSAVYPDLVAAEPRAIVVSALPTGQATRLMLDAPVDPAFAHLHVAGAHEASPSPIRFPVVPERGRALRSGHIVTSRRNDPLTATETYDPVDVSTNT
jgi:hypothetical protein